MFVNGRYIPRAANVVRPEILSEHRVENIPHGLQDDIPNFVEINWRPRCGCGSNIILDDDVRQKPREQRLYKCSNPNLTHFFIKSTEGRRREVYKYDNFYMKKVEDENIVKYIPTMPTIEFDHTNRRHCSNNSLQFYNKTTGVFESLRRYIFSDYKVPVLFREYLKKLRKSVGRAISSELYVIGVQYRTYPFDIQLGITETYKEREPNNRARVRAKREELQINNHRPNKNKYMGKIGDRVKWYIRYINHGNYHFVAPINVHINFARNDRDRKAGLLIVGTEEELRPICQNFSAENINSRDDAIARPIIIKLDHILKRGHLSKWFDEGHHNFDINQNELRHRRPSNQISAIIGSLNLGANAKIAPRIAEIRNHQGSKSGAKSRSRSENA